MVVVTVVTFAKHAGCTPLHVLAVAMRLKYLSSHEATGLTIAAIVTRRKALASIATVDRAGNSHE
jgi:hypothetical protein